MASAARGRCYCGEVQLEIEAIFDCGYCHCEDCRRASGAPVWVTVVARREAFGIVAGEPARHQRLNGTQRFCATCGGPVCYEFRASVGDLVSVGVGTLDDPAHCPPAFHQFASRRLPWLFLHDELPKYADNRLPHPRDRR